MFDGTVYLDYVDRGQNSLEVICLLLLLKMRHPKKIHMLRGNHECSAVNAAYGFKAECEKRFQKAPSDNAVWGLTEVGKLVACLGSDVLDLDGLERHKGLVAVPRPLQLVSLHGAYQSEDPHDARRYIQSVRLATVCLVSGLSPLLNSLDQLRKLERPIDPSTAGLHVDLLW